jgi:hypothetical protein
MTNHWPLQRECEAFYGRPDGDNNGEPDRAWEDANLQRIVPPWKMYLAWDVAKPVANFRIHRLCVPSLASILGTIWAHAGCSQNKIEEMRLHLFGGAYNYRTMRGSNRLSMHSYGCAIDLDPENNPMGKAWNPDLGMLPMSVVQAFEAEGWSFGGRWQRPDAMHFQAARVL